MENKIFNSGSSDKENIRQLERELQICKRALQMLHQENSVLNQENQSLLGKLERVKGSS